jgi:uncharacterized membrane protein required for colicin V production
MEATWTVSQQMLIGVAAALFGYLGFRRGINRELLQMIGIFVSMVAASQLAPAMQGMVNRLYRLFRLMFTGALVTGDLMEAWQEVQALPPLVRTPEDVQMLSLVTFIVVLFMFYLIGQYQLPQPKGLALRLMGTFVGVINGFLIIYYLFPMVFTRPQAIILLPSEEVHQTLTDEQTVARIVALFIVVLIAFGLYTASTPKSRGSNRGDN